MCVCMYLCLTAVTWKNNIHPCTPTERPSSFPRPWNLYCSHVARRPWPINTEDLADFCHLAHMQVSLPHVFFLFCVVLFVLVLVRLFTVVHLLISIRFFLFRIIFAFLLPPSPPFFLLPPLPDPSLHSGERVYLQRVRRCVMYPRVLHVRHSESRPA
jgi:hypothetical protein